MLFYLVALEGRTFRLNLQLTVLRRYKIDVGGKTFGLRRLCYFMYLVAVGGKTFRLRDCADISCSCWWKNI